MQTLSSPGRPGPLPHHWAFDACGVQRARPFLTTGHLLRVAVWSMESAVAMTGTSGWGTGSVQSRALAPSRPHLGLPRALLDHRSEDWDRGSAPVSSRPCPSIVGTVTVAWRWQVGSKGFCLPELHGPPATGAEPGRHGKHLYQPGGECSNPGPCSWHPAQLPSPVSQAVPRLTGLGTAAPLCGETDFRR